MRKGEARAMLFFKFKNIAYASILLDIKNVIYVSKKLIIKSYSTVAYCSTEYQHELLCKNSLQQASNK